MNVFLFGQYVPANILYKYIAGRYRPVRVADGPITARHRFIKNAYWGFALKCVYVCVCVCVCVCVFMQITYNI